MQLLLVSICLAAFQSGENAYSPAKPQALLALEQARLSIRKAELSWGTSDFFSSLSHGAKKYRRAVISGRQIALFEDGTAEGVTAWYENGEPVYRPRAELRTDNAYWSFDRGGMLALLWEDRPPLAVPDEVRTGGLQPTPVFALSVQEALWDSPKNDRSPREYREQVVDGIHEVELRMTDSGAVYRWYIDPQRGWNPVRCQGLYQGRVFAESVCEYQSFGDVWLPVSAAYFNSMGDLVTLVEVDSAKVNSPDTPEELTPEILGLGNGMAVIPQTGNRAIPDGTGNLI